MINYLFKLIAMSRGFACDSTALFSNLLEHRKMNLLPCYFSRLSFTFMPITAGTCTESEQESLKTWALDRLSRSCLCRDYDFTNYWSFAGVQKVSNSALEQRYRFLYRPYCSFQSVKVQSQQCHVFF